MIVDNRNHIFCISFLVLFLSFTFPGTAGEGTGRGPWLKRETEHFVFIFQEEGSESADELIQYAEEVYSEVTKFFEFYPEKVRCLIYADTDRANGYFTPMPPHHISVFTAFPVNHTFKDGNDSWLRIVFTHELVHHVHLTADYGFLAGASRIFGEPVKNTAGGFLPGWAIEGITVYLETALTSGGRGRSSFFELYYKAPILEDAFMSPEQTAYESSYPPPGRIYVAGYILTDYLLEHYGRETYQKIYREYLSFPFLGYYRAVERVTGKPFEEIFYRMKVELEEQFTPFLAFPKGTRVSPEETGNFSLPVPTERGLITFRRTPLLPGALVLIDPETREEEILFETPLSDNASFSADKTGRKIAFSASTWDYTRKGNPAARNKVYLLDAESGEVRAVDKSGGMYHPALSPDSTEIAAVRRRGSSSRLEIRMIDDDDWSVLPIPTDGVILNPVFSPEGESIAFTLDRGGKQRCWIIRRKGPAWGDPEAIPLPPGGEAFNPRFGPDGNALYFSSDRDGCLSIYRYSFSNRELVHLYREQIGAKAAFPYRDGLLYSSYSSSGNTVKFAPPELFLGERVDTGAVTGVRGAPRGNPALSKAALPAAESYRDVPLPALWFPYLTFTQTEKYSPDIGAGFYTMGNTLLGGMSWELSAGFHPTVLQPTGLFSLSLDLSPVILSYSITQNYGTYSSAAIQDTDQRLSITCTPLSRNRLGRILGLQFSTGFLYSYRQYGQGDFPFYQGPNETHYTAFSLAAGLSGSRNSAPAILFPRVSAGVSGEGEIAVPLLPPYYSGFRAGLTGQVTFPAGKVRGSMRFFAGADYVSPGLTGRFPYRTLTPPGFTGFTRNAPGSLLTGLSYRVTLAVMDQPVIVRVNLLGIGANFFIYKDFEYTPDPLSFTADRYIYPGLELTALLGISHIGMPFKFGAAMRLDPLFREPFSFKDDIGFFLNFDLPL